MKKIKDTDLEYRLWEMVSLNISKKLKKNEPLSASQQNIYDIIEQTDEFQKIYEQNIKDNDKIIDGDVFIHKRTGNEFAYHFPLRILSDFS